MNMSKSSKGTTENPGKNVAQKSGLNRSILDAGWGGIVQVLNVKAESAGRHIEQVNPRNTSRTCSACGQIDKASRNGVKFVCTYCGYADHADVNAAINILTRAEQSLTGERAAPVNAPFGVAGGSPPIHTSA